MTDYKLAASTNTSPNAQNVIRLPHSGPQAPVKAGELIRVRGARTHNLKNINLDLPRNQRGVITGLPVLGHSPVAFDTTHADGRDSAGQTRSA